MKKSIKKNLFTAHEYNIHGKISNNCIKGVKNDLSGIEKLNESGNKKVKNRKMARCETHSWTDYKEHFNSDVGFIIENSDDECVDLSLNTVKQISSDCSINKAKSLCFNPEIQNVSEFLDNCLDATELPSKSNYTIEAPVISEESMREHEFEIECPFSDTNLSQDIYSPSYPPAVNLPKDKVIDHENFDSASKTRAPRIKKGSFVERLRRLLRAERAEVNMFNHERPLHQITQSCTLQVDSVVKTCSRLMLSCHQINEHHAGSEDFSSGKEVLDPEVHVCVDPVYAKNITSGCTIIVYPPWCSLWADNRGITTLYGTTKLHVKGFPSDFTYLSQTSAITSGDLQHEFSCRFEEDYCLCQLKLIGELFNRREEMTCQQVAADDSVKGALTSGYYPHCFQLRLSILHSFKFRHQETKVLPGLLCLDSNNNVCQLNLQCPEDGRKLQNMMKESNSSTIIIKHVTLYKRVYINRCRGLRSMVTQLHKGSDGQELMYVVTPSSSEWTAEPLHDTLESAFLPRNDFNLHEIQVEPHEMRVNAKFLVLALRKDILYVFSQELDTFFKIRISSSAVIPAFSSRNVLLIQFLHYFAGNMMLDKFSIVTVVKEENLNFPIIQSLSVHSVEGDLVLLDGVVTRANSGVLLRWEGDCGHSLLKPIMSSHYYCGTCKQTVANYYQRISLEVCVATDLEPSIRVKVKNETAQVFLLGRTGHVSPNKSYNMISMIGASLKCVTVVLEVLKNASGDVLEFLLEEV